MGKRKVIERYERSVFVWKEWGKDKEPLQLLYRDVYLFHSGYYVCLRMEAFHFSILRRLVWFFGRLCEVVFKEWSIYGHKLDEMFSPTIKEWRRFRAFGPKERNKSRPLRINRVTSTWRVRERGSLVKCQTGIILSGVRRSETPSDAIKSLEGDKHGRVE